MAYEETILILQAITVAVVIALAYSIRRVLLMEKMILRVEQTLLSVDKKIASKIKKK